MRIPVIVNGAFGKMGTIACNTLRDHPKFELVGALGRKDNLSQTIQQTKAQIVIELTNAESVYENSLTIIQQNAHPIIGASGLNAQQIQYLQDLSAAKELGGIIVPNFSISVALMMQCAALIAAQLSDVEIIESHHAQKLDSPSATAIKTARMIAENRPTKSHKNTQQAARGELHYDIPIHSLRLPGVLARQDVIFGSLGETLTLSHNTLDRQSFMPGMLLACEHVQHIKELQYGLEKILTISRNT
jgi:4-hydroxy-tetrahydrodipicolinate reductase